MSTAERRMDRARQASRSIQEEVGRDLRRARLSHDLSLVQLAAASGLSRSQISRIERAELPHVALEDLVTVGALLGLRVWVRSFPNGVPLRDTAHLALLERLRSILHPSLGWAQEVPVALPGSGDLRAWDATIRGEPWRIGVEAETRARDAQELERRLALKQRDGHVDHLILLLADTRWNRRAVRAAGAGLTSLLPLDGPRILDALRAGREPEGSGIVLL